MLQLRGTLCAKSFIVALAALAATASFAQSTATISGSIQAGINNTGAASAETVATHLGNGSNAINIQTTEDLGGGMTSGFDSQIRFNAVTGDMNSSGTAAGSSFFHAANVRLGGSFGTVRLGKIAEAGNVGFDPWGANSGAAMTAGASNSAATVIGRTAGAGTSALVGAGTQANSISYTTPTVSGFSASYQTTVSTRVNERQVLSLNYANGPLTVQYLATKNSGNAASNATLAITNAVADANGKATSIGASYNFGVATVAVFNAKTTAATTAAHATALGGLNIDRNVTAVTATAPMGAYTLLAGYAKDSKQTADKDTKMALGVNYALSKRTTLGADVYKDEALWDAKGAAGTGFTLRARHTF